MMKVLHIASWYPNPWDNIAGNFVRDQTRVFSQEIPAEVVVVEVRYKNRGWPEFKSLILEGGAKGYFLFAPVRIGKMMEWLSTFFLIVILIREKAWRFDVFHFHIAYPLLMHSRIWRWIFCKQIIISEHWTAYHYNFNLSEKSSAIKHIRCLFKQGYPVFAVSQALIEDITKFSQVDNFKSFVIPNVVPLHGVTNDCCDSPVLFSVNIWEPRKNPLPMLEGLNRAAAAGSEFKLVIGGYGTMIDEMVSFVGKSALKEITTFSGKMSKSEIAAQLGRSNGYIFASNYETFSIACAEALGAGLPLIGPHIYAIAEYAGEDDWIVVKERNSESWQLAIEMFIEKRNNGGWNHTEIAERASMRFSENVLRAQYRSAMEGVGLNLKK